jgi:hypothetical protein
LGLRAFPLIPTTMHSIVPHTSFAETLQELRAHSLDCKGGDPKTVIKCWLSHAAPMPAMGGEDQLAQDRGTRLYKTEC